jgi:hypothetical protein
VLGLSFALVLGCGRTELWHWDDWEAGAAGSGGASAGTGGAGGAGFGGAGFGGAGFGGAEFGGAGFGGAGFGGAGFGGAGFGGVSAAGLGGMGGVPVECGTFADPPDVHPASPPVCAGGRPVYSVFVDVPGTAADPNTYRPLVSLTACHFDVRFRTREVVTSDELEGIDVLLLMPRRTIMAPAEKQVIQAFVAEGHSVLAYVDYSSEYTVGTAPTYQAVLDILGAVYEDTDSGPGPTFTTLASHPITQGVNVFAVYAASAVSGSGYVPVALLGCPVAIARDTGTSRFVVNGDSTPIFGGMEFDSYDHERLFLQTIEWLVRER